MDRSDSRPPVWALREFVYGFIVRSGIAPTAEEVADGLDLDLSAAKDGLARLHTLHAIFLDANGHIRMANPFSGVPTDFQVRSGGVSYWANCAWDALGIPAALGAVAEVTAIYAEDRSPASLRIADDRVEGRGVVHFMLPFRRWYDDLLLT